MKKIWRLYAFTVVIFLCSFVLANYVQSFYREDTFVHRNVVMNRVTEAIQGEFNGYSEEEKQKDEETLVTSVIQKVYYDDLEAWKKDYHQEYLPQVVTFISAKNETSGVSYLAEAGSAQSIWVLYHEKDVVGFILFKFHDCQLNRVVQIMNFSILLCFVMVMALLSYVYFKILKPFYKLQGYPERLSKGYYAEKFPETKNRMFGKFIWGVNMLNDKMSYDKKYINKLIKERQTLLTTIAHGIKTPVSNIKLYANAIETGLYQESGVANECDAKVASKINKNADDIAVLVQEMIKTSSEGLVDFQPDIQTFYTKELEDYVKEEYSNRLKVLRITFTVNCNDDSMMQSDRKGLFRILSQLLENAIKYGDGSGITVQMEKQEEGHYISVRSKGNLISENELPYIFNSFWRGSNASDKEGSGIGLFEAQQIVQRLSGEIFVKRIETSDEMEFLIYIP